MNYTVSGLDADIFRPLFSLNDDELERRNIVRKTVDAHPGFPCRISLEDAKIGDTVLLLNYETHSVDTPYRSSYAIYVNETAKQGRQKKNTLPGVFKNRPIALRVFDESAMLIMADMGMNEDLEAKIKKIFADPKAAYIHAHNAMHGCFVAEIQRA